MGEEKLIVRLVTQSENKARSLQGKCFFQALEMYITYVHIIQLQNINVIEVLHIKWLQEEVMENPRKF